LLFDGHGGPFDINNKHVADYCSKNLHFWLQKYILNINSNYESGVVQVLKREHEIDLNDQNKVIDVIKKAFVSFDLNMYYLNLNYGCTCTAINRLFQ